MTTVYIGAHFEWTGSAATMVKYYYAGGQRVAMRKGTANPTYLLGDHLGSTSITANSNGSLATEQRYFPWGATRYGSSLTAFQYTGQRNDSSIGLYFYNARYYDPALGRFTQADSIVPGAADSAGGGAATLGYDSNTRLTPLTVNLGEFAAQINEENREILRFGAFFQWDAQTQRRHNVPMGPENPQALNRYAYCLNNPLRYVDPTGHNIRLQTFTMAAWAAYDSRIDKRIHDLETQAFWVGGIGGAIGGGIITGVATAMTDGAVLPFAEGIFAFSSAPVGIPLGLMAEGADAIALQKALDYINIAADDLTAMGITEFELVTRLLYFES